MGKTYGSEKGWKEEIIVVSKRTIEGKYTKSGKKAYIIGYMKEDKYKAKRYHEQFVFENVYNALEEGVIVEGHFITDKLHNNELKLIGVTT